MYKFLTHPLIQAILVLLFRKQWILINENDFRIVTEVYHIEGDPEVSPMYRRGWWSNWPVLSQLINSSRKSLVMLERKKLAVFRIYNGFGSYIGSLDFLGNRRVLIGKTLNADQIITLKVGLEDVDFFLLSFDLITSGPRPRMEFLYCEEHLSGWQKFYNML